MSPFTNPLYHICSSCRMQYGTIDSSSPPELAPSTQPTALAVHSLLLSSREEITTISIPRHHIVFLILSCSASLKPLPPDYAATFFQYLATLVCSCAVVALALATVIERPVGPFVPDAFQRRELVTTGAWGLLCYSGTQALAFAIVAGIKEKCEKVTLEVVSGPAFWKTARSVHLRHNCSGIVQYNATNGTSKVLLLW